MKNRVEWDLSQYEINSDENPTFVIGDPMKKVHMGNNKSLVNPASANKIVPSYGVVMVLESIFREVELYTLNNFIYEITYVSVEWGCFYEMVWQNF